MSGEKPLFTTKSGLDVFLADNPNLGYVERPTQLGLGAKETEEDLGILGTPITEPIRLYDPAARQYGALLLRDDL